MTWPTSGEPSSGHLRRPATTIGSRRPSPPRWGIVATDARRHHGPRPNHHHLKADLERDYHNWLAVASPATSATYDISHVFSTPPGRTYDIKVYAKDDNGNESAASNLEPPSWPLNP